MKRGTAAPERHGQKYLTKLLNTYLVSVTPGLKHPAVLAILFLHEAEARRQNFADHRTNLNLLWIFRRV
jgi:hypothetical protein